MGVPPNHPSHGWPWLSIQTNGDPMVIQWGSTMTYDPSISKGPTAFSPMILPSLDDRLLTLFFGIETPLVSTMSYNQSLYLWWWSRQIITTRHPGWHQPYSFSGSNCARCTMVPHHTPVAPVSGGTILLGQSYMDTLILTSLLVLMGISTNQQKKCRVSKIGNDLYTQK